MSPIGDATLIRVAGQTAKELQAQPDDQHDIGRDREDTEIDDKNQQDIHTRFREQKQISPHYPGDRTRSTYSWHARTGGRDYMDQSRANTRQQIEQQERQVAHLIFEIVAEDPQKQHVADQMHPAIVQKHRSDQRFKCNSVRDARRNDGIVEVYLVDQSRVLRHPYIAEEDQNVRSHQDIDNKRRSIRRVMIADRKHEATLGFPRPGVKALLYHTQDFPTL